MVTKTALTSKLGTAFVALALATIATYGLFVLMMALMAVEYNPRAEVREHRVHAVKDNAPETVELIDVIELQKNHLDTLLSPINPPPLLKTKALPTANRYNLNHIQTDVILPGNFVFNVPSRPQIDPIMPRGNSDTSIDIHITQTPGVIQCDLEITLGRSINEIEQIIWKDCIGAEASDGAELAAYKWVATAPQSFKNLNPSPGDVLAFSFKKTLNN